MARTVVVWFVEAERLAGDRAGFGHLWQRKGGFGCGTGSGFEHRRGVSGLTLAKLLGKTPRWPRRHPFSQPCEEGCSSVSTSPGARVSSSNRAFL